MNFTRKDIHGLLIIGACVLFGVVAVVIALKLREPKQAYGADLCPYEIPYAHTVILLDKTDPFTPSQKLKLMEAISRVKARLHKYEKLSIYVLDHTSFRAPVPVFSLCNPGSPENADPLYQNPRKIKKYYDEQFGEPLNSSLQDLVHGGSAQYSPILEMIHAVSLISDFSPAQPARDLIIFSDMMQNTPQYSQYKELLDYKRFAQTQYAASVRADLKNARVKVVYLLRPELHPFQSQPAHQNFWGAFFDEAGARSIEFERAS